MYFSDRLLKENIQSLEDHTLDKLAKIHPVRYTFKDQQTKPAGMQIGMIAQEVQTQFPELVTEGSDGFLSLSYSNFTAGMLKGMQEQQVKILGQQNQIQEQQKELEEQQTQNQEQEELLKEQQKQLEEKDLQIRALQAQVQRLDHLVQRLARLEKRDHHRSDVDAE